MSQITIEHLLDHKAGWDKQLACDLTYQEQQIKTELNLQRPATAEEIACWATSHPLQHDPGSVYNYSNLGYLCLGLVIQRISSTSLLDFLQQRVLGPLGVPPEMLIIGHSLAYTQDTREPFYDSDGSRSANIFYPDQSKQKRVPSAYGGACQERRVGQGDLAAHPTALLAFLNRFQVNGDRAGVARRVGGKWKWNQTGSICGTSALIRQHSDALDFVVLFNKRDKGKA